MGCVLRYNPARLDSFAKRPISAALLAEPLAKLSYTLNLNGPYHEQKN